MPDKSDFGLSEWHETIRGGERVLIRRARPEDTALYLDFLGDVSAEDCVFWFEKPRHEADQERVSSQEMEVSRIYRRRVNVYQDFIVCRRGFFYLFELKHIR